MNHMIALIAGAALSENRQDSIAGLVDKVRKLYRTRAEKQARIAAV
jgi:hypothetical protein